MLTWLNSNRSLHARESFWVCSAHKRPILLKSIEIIPGISDHDGIIIADLYLSAQINKRYPHNIPLWSQVNWEAIQALQETSATNSWTILHITMWNRAWKNLSLTSRTSWRSTPLRRLSPATFTFLGCLHCWRGWLRRRVICIYRSQWQVEYELKNSRK